MSEPIRLKCPYCNGLMVYTGTRWVTCTITTYGSSPLTAHGGYSVCENCRYSEEQNGYVGFVGDGNNAKAR